MTIKKIVRVRIDYEDGSAREVVGAEAEDWLRRVDYFVPGKFTIWRDVPAPTVTQGDVDCAKAMNAMFGEGYVPVPVVGATAVPAYPPGQSLIATIKQPDCLTCSDRGRVWDGEDGETRSCPDCANWGVWCVYDPRDKEPFYESHWDFTKPHALSKAAAEKRAAEFNAAHELRAVRYWRAEVRELPEELRR